MNTIKPAIPENITKIETRHPPPVIVFPILRCRPDFVVGMLVVFEIFLFKFDIPTARLQLKDTPGIPVFVPFLLAIMLPP